MRRAVMLMLLMAGCAALAACSKPKVPDHDDRPEPQAAAPVAPPTQLRETMRKPIDKAEAAQAKTAAAEKARDDALNAATGQ